MSTATATDFNARVAEKVMGVSIRAYNASPASFAYDTDANADYQVLCHVRERWRHVEYRKIEGDRLERFGRRLHQIMSARLEDGDIKAIGYEPGDYARAALAVVEAKG